MVCFFFKQKTAYELRISDWISDVCSSDLPEKWVANIELGYFVLDTVAIQFAGTTPATTPNKPAGSLEAVPNLGNDKFSIFTLTGTYHPLRGGDRTSVVSGKSVSVRVDLGGRRNIKNKKS